jgi:hypothetical protein
LSRTLDAGAAQTGLPQHGVDPDVLLDSDALAAGLGAAAKPRCGKPS